MFTNNILASLYVPHMHICMFQMNYVRTSTPNLKIACVQVHCTSTRLSFTTKK